jgi:CO/xanthine dehydrogenase Mo-binding subunit
MVRHDGGRVSSTKLGWGDSDRDGFVGSVATVEVNRKTGAIRVKHCAVVQDCGQIINPDGVKNQIEGNVLQIVPARI